MAQGSVGEAQAAIDQSLKILRQLRSADQEGFPWLADLAEAQELMAAVLKRRGKKKEADEAAERAKTLRARLDG